MMRISPVLDAQGMEQPNAFVIRDEKLIERGRDLSEQYIKTHGNKNIDQPEKGRNYQIEKGSNANKNLLAEYLALEKRHARRVANHLVEEGYFPNAMAIPILYGADSAIHTAEGVMDGLWGATSTKYKLFPVDRKLRAPEEALEMAKKCGAILFCDSVIDCGNVSRDILQEIPSDIKGPDGAPLKVITYFNYATHAEPGIVPDKPYGAEKSIRGLSKLRDALEKAGHQHYFFVNEIGDLNHDLFDRADAIACVAAEKDKLRFYTSKFLKPEKHNAVSV